MMDTIEACAVVVAIERKRPPKQVLRVDLTVEVEQPANWLLVATSVAGRNHDGYEGVAPQGIHTIDRFEIAPGQSIVWMKGDAGAYAIPLGASRIAQIAGLGVDSWGPMPADPVIGVAQADEVLVRGKPLFSWFDPPFGLWTETDVDAGKLSPASTIGQRLTTDFDRPFELEFEAFVGSSAPIASAG
jgi:hypothetical protein